MLFSSRLLVVLIALLLLIHEGNGQGRQGQDNDKSFSLIHIGDTNTYNTYQNGKPRTSTTTFYPEEEYFRRKSAPRQMFNPRQRGQF